MKTKRKTKKEFKKRILEKYGYEMKYSGKLKKWFRHRVIPVKKMNWKESVAQDKTFESIAIKGYLMLPKEMKLEDLRKSFLEDNISHFTYLCKILLDAPISDGGISTEEIEELRIKLIDEKY